MRPRTLSESSPNKTALLNRRLAADVRQYSQSVMPAFLHTMALYTILLPPLQSLPERFRQYFCDKIISVQMKRTLEEAKIINWCRTVKPLLPLYTKGDGNCLLHAASIAIWGIHDKLLFLRNQLHSAFTRSQTAESLKQRWKREKIAQLCRIPDIDIDTKDWEAEWELVTSATKDTRFTEPGKSPFAYLEEIHIFTLANILKRPIVVLGEAVARTMTGSALDVCNFPGIYLPLMWKSSDVIRTPIVLGYDSHHFVPLVSQEDTPEEKILAAAAVHGVPLVTHDLAPLYIHFLLPGETGYDGHNLLTQYMKVNEVVLTKSDGIVHVLTAKLEHEKIEPDFDIMRDFYQQMERNFQDSINSPPNSSPKEKKREVKVKNVSKVDESSRGSGDNTAAHRAVHRSNSHRHSSPQLASIIKCKTAGCKYYGCPETGGMCSTCFNLYTKHNSSKRSASANTPVSALRDQEAGGEKRWSCPPTSSSTTYEKEYNTAAGHSRQAQPERELYHTPPPGHGEDPDPSYIYSMTSTQCQAPNCYYLASAKIYPFCHEHAYLLNPTTTRGQAAAERHQKSSSLGRTSFSGPLGLIPGDENSHENHMSRSLDDVLIGGKKNKSVMCIIGGCKFHGNAKHRNMCSEHYREIIVASPLPQNEEVLPLEMLTRKRAGSREKCKKSGCVRVGEPKLEGHCNVCHLGKELQETCLSPSLEIINNTDTGGAPKANYQTKVLEQCKNENCTRIGTAQTEDYCTQCFVQKTRHHQRLSQETTSENGQETMETEEASPATVCTMPGCTGVPLHHGYCLFCYQDQQEGQHPVPNTNSTKVVPSDKKPVAPSSGIRQIPLPGSNVQQPTPGEEERPSTAPAGGRGFHHPSGLARQFSEGESGAHLLIGEIPVTMETEEISMTSYEEQVSSVNRCHFPECDNVGHDVLRGLCVDCYNTLCEKAARQKPRVPSTRTADHTGERQRHPRPLSVAMPTSSMRPSGAQYCLHQGCDMFGDPNFEGYCSQCYRRLMARRPSEEEGPLRPFAGTQRPVSYANYLQIGAANHITIGQESNMPSPPSSEAGSGWQTPHTNEVEPNYMQAAARIETASRSSISRCSSTNCPNYGHSKNMGYCNSCFVRVKGSHGLT